VCGGKGELSFLASGFIVGRTFGRCNEGSERKKTMKALKEKRKDPERHVSECGV
jgi:hypothetical protein